MASTNETLSAPALANAAFDMACRFEDGATLWCVAPASPDHARHVAVEFVHPVIVGKRALPALSLTGGAAADDLRARSRPGDVLLVITPAPDPGAARLIRRARLWGLVTVWLVGSEAAAASVPTADHTLVCPAATGVYGPEDVLAYHLLWELTHVCLEHPGLLTERSTSGERCVTCADEGRPAEVIDVEGSTARVRSAAGEENVEVGLVGPVGPGDVVLIHAGVAISGPVEDPA